jgi:hypothetical protein
MLYKSSALFLLLFLLIVLISDRTLGLVPVCLASGEMPAVILTVNDVNQEELRNFAAGGTILECAFIGTAEKNNIGVFREL